MQNPNLWESNPYTAKGVVFFSAESWRFGSFLPKTYVFVNQKSERKGAKKWAPPTPRIALWKLDVVENEKTKGHTFLSFGLWVEWSSQNLYILSFFSKISKNWKRSSWYRISIWATLSVVLRITEVSYEKIQDHTEKVSFVPLVSFFLLLDRNELLVFQTELQDGMNHET